MREIINPNTAVLSAGSGGIDAVSAREENEV
jgi:hypothetical protein